MASLVLDCIRTEVAWTSGALAAAPAWEDMSSITSLEAGCGWNRGRPDVQSQVSPGSFSFSLRNDDGQYTPNLTTSPRYPFVTPGPRARQTVRATSGGAQIPGNFLSANAASMETDISAWLAAGVAPTMSQDTLHVQDGTKALHVVWVATGSSTGVATIATGLTIGRQYTASAYIYVPTGSAVVNWNVAGFGLQATTVNDVYQRRNITFVATSTTHTLQAIRPGGSTAGQEFWIDAVQLDEGAAVVTFTTSAPPITGRFDGPINSIEAVLTPDGAVANIVASDILSQLGDNRPLRSILSEEILNDAPLAYWPLGEASGASAAGDVSGVAGNGQLTATQRGAGGTLTFGTGTGPGTDGIPAATLAPSSTTNGLYLTTGVQQYLAAAFAISLEAFINTSTAASQLIVKVLDNSGSFLTLEVTAASKLIANFNDAALGVVGTVTSAGNVTGGTKHVAVTVQITGTAALLTLYLDGASAGTAAWTQGTGLLYGWNQVYVGGSATDNLLTATLSHVAVRGGPALSAARVQAHRDAGITGFLSELSGTRANRLLRLAGLPTALINTEAGLTTMATQATNGQAALTSLQDVATSERGVMFAAGDGRGTFHGRAHRYNASATATLDAQADLGQTDFSALVNDTLLLNDVSGTRPSGAQQRAVNAASVALRGTYQRTVNLLGDSDALAQLILQAMANQFATPMPRSPDLVIDMLTITDAQAAAVLALDVGSRVDVSGLPALAPASSLQLFVEGIAERSSGSTSGAEWSVTLSTSPAANTAAWVLDSPVFSQLDSTTILAL